MKTHTILTTLALATALSLSSCISIESHTKPATTTVTKETYPTATGLAQTTQTTTTRAPAY